MKVLILSDANSSHTQKWILGLRDKGLEMYLFSLTSLDSEIAKIYKGIEVYSIDHKSGMGYLAKMKSYVRAVQTCRRLVKRLNLDILHAHSVSSYGLLGTTVGFKNFAISVWGSDIYSFPKKSKISELFTRFALSRAQKVFSSSFDMARETRIYCNKNIDVIPFGVGELFFEASGSKPEDVLNFATAKSLNNNYNIPLVVEAFRLCLEMMPDEKIELHIAGSGNEFEKCRLLAGELIDKQIFFKGHLAHSQMSVFFRDKHVLINIPEMESFGVSVLEASAAGMAVIATNRGGLPEVVQDGVTGILVKAPVKKDVVDAMIRLIKNRSQIAKMGQAGTAFVRSKYAWDNSVEKQIEKYTEMLNLK